jgi:two-component system cell cycle sensor histidine kinase/response regulator CckA
MRASDMAAPQAPHDVRIMVVDDEPAVRSVLARALRREGYTIVDACDGIEALRLLSSSSHTPVHLLITDINMPRLGGLDLARQVRAANHVRRVIFMSGDIEADTTESEGHSVMLWKPFSLRALSATVREVLAR